MQIAPVILSKSERAELEDGLRGLPIHRLRLSGIGKDRCGQTTGSPGFFGSVRTSSAASSCVSVDSVILRSRKLGNDGIKFIDQQVAIVGPIARYLSLTLT